MEGQLRQYTCSSNPFDLISDDQSYPSVGGWFPDIEDWTAEARQIETTDTLQNVELPSDFPQPSSLSCEPKEISEGDNEGRSDSSHASMTESLSAWATGHRLDDQESSQYSQGDITGESESVGDLEPRYVLRLPISNGQIDRLAWAHLAEELRTGIFTRFIMWGKSQSSGSDDLGYAVFQPQTVDVYDTLTRMRTDGNFKDLGDGLLMMIRPESEGEIRKKFLNHAKDWVAKQESDWCHPPIHKDPVSYYFECFDNRLILRFHIQLPREEIDRSFCDANHILYPKNFSRWEFCEDCFCKRREILGSKRSSGLPTCYC
jgi:hypothetical protein